MVNSDRGRTIADDIVRAIAREYEWPDYPPGEVRDVIALPAERLRRYEGTFEGEGHVLAVARADGGLVLYDPGDRRRVPARIARSRRPSTCRTARSCAPAVYLRRTATRGASDRSP